MAGTDGGFRRALHFAFVWILLPNLPFALLSIWYCPSRLVTIAFYAMLGLASRAVRWPVIAAFFLGAYALDVASTVAMFFGLKVVEVFVALGDIGAGMVDPFYAAMAVLFIACPAVTLILSRTRHTQIALAPLRLALPLTLLAVGADAAANVNFAYGAKIGGLLNDYIYAGSEPVESAVEASGVAERALTEKRTLLVVMVESLGLFEDDKLNRRILAPLADPRIRQRYDMVQGAVPFFGSTTAAEIREFCGIRTSYVFLSEMEGKGCLPGRLAAQGYETVAYHGFSRTLFDRESWYPLIGFERFHFEEDLAAGLAGAPRCGSVFEGFCDHDVARRVHRELAGGGGPRLVYWLTLNSHYPAVRRDGYGLPFACEQDEKPIGDEMVCIMAEYWLEVIQDVRAMALDPALPPMDILLVGDHFPPLFSRGGRAMFDPEKVPWVALLRRP